MKKKLERLAKEHLITVCCECLAIKVDSNNWLHESEAHRQGLHHDYLELHAKKIKSHGYCFPCYDRFMKKVPKRFY